MVGSLVFSTGFMIASRFELAKRTYAGPDVGDHPGRKQGGHALQDLAAQKSEVMGDRRARNADEQRTVSQGVRARVLAQEIPANIRVDGENLVLAPAPVAADVADYGRHQRRGGFRLALAAART